MRKMNNVKFGALFLASLMLFEPTLHAAQFVSYARQNRVFESVAQVFGELSFIKTDFNEDWLTLKAYEQLNHSAATSIDEFDYSAFLDDADFMDAQWVNTVHLASPMPDGGPYQQEFQSFAPIEASDMVDPFTGDFSYNIPLFDVDGYPVNISYNAGVTMAQEASWVGLGWTLNPGVINRTMRGIPDEFNGTDIISKQVNFKPVETVSAKFILDLEIFGIGKPKKILPNPVFRYSNYDGWSLSRTVGLNLGKWSTSKLMPSLELTFSSSDGVYINPDLAYNTVRQGGEGLVSSSLSIGAPWNSRAGIREISLSSYKQASQDCYVSNSHSFYGQGHSQYSFNIGMSTYKPSIQVPTKTRTFGGTIKLGSDAPSGLDKMLYFYFKHDKTSIHNAYRNRNYSAFGYMHMSNGQTEETAILDFNRENDGMFTRNTPSLPIPRLTYDLYRVNAQGFGASFRPVQPEIGYVFDHTFTDGSFSLHGGAEIALGMITHVGIDLVSSWSKTRAGLWNDDKNFARKKIGFGNNVFHFREAGELSVQKDMNVFNSMGGNNPAAFELKSINKLSDKLIYKNVGSSLSSGYLTGEVASQSNQNARNRMLYALSIGEVRNGMGIGTFPNTSLAATLPNIEHHIGEFTILGSDGIRFVYGLPAYNTFEVEASFSVNEFDEITTGQYNSNFLCEHGLVLYNPSGDNPDNSILNSKGTNNHFERVMLSPYSHAHLLTCVLSPDYVDSDSEQGPSVGDLGGYLKIEYSSPVESNWRNPIIPNSAFYDDGLSTLQGDNKGHYFYGGKELWYVSSIETKNHIAVFRTSPRNDAAEALNENGGFSTGVMQKLDRIDLYLLSEYNLNGDNATPIKSVHFVYDYELCPNYHYNSTPNELGTGKLTLKSIYFTYQGSFRGEYMPYNFEYSSHNPSYNIKHVDKWGNYQRISDNYTCGSHNVADGKRPWDSPYVAHDEELANMNASAWNLTTIHLPSGSKIEIDYEADSYGFVQNKPVNKMFEILDANIASINVNAQNINSILQYNNELGYVLVENQNYNMPYIDVPYEGFEAQDYVDKNNSWIYFKVLMNIWGQNNFEYVPGFARIFHADKVYSSTLQDYVIRLWLIPAPNSLVVHPIRYAGIEFARINLNNQIPPAATSPNLNDPLLSPDGTSFLNAFIGMYTVSLEMIVGPINSLAAYSNFASLDNIILPKSMVRLVAPDNKQFGGGHRVKEIRIYDASEAIFGLQDHYYGQRFKYINEDGSTSGVASYEPQVGGDENVWRQPVHYRIKNLLAPDRLNFQMEPFGEQFFPSPIVGYSRVEISQLSYENVTKNTTGKVIHEFYTAKDFPTIARRIAPDPKRVWIPIPFIFMKTQLSVSQGFCIETNDMHGKIKSVTVLGKEDKLISQNTYFYKEEIDQYLGHRVLKNDVTVINRNGGIDYNATIGLQFDAFADFRHSKSASNEIKFFVNSNLVFPAWVVPMILGGYSRTVEEFKSASFVKTIERFGILERVVSTELGSVIETANLAWDAETGEVLITKTKTNFEDELFSFTYPAHWHYDLMGQACHNTGNIFMSSNFNDVLNPGHDYPLGGNITIFSTPFIFSNGSTNQFNNSNFNPGDELILTFGGASGNSSIKAWVTQTSPNGIRVLDKEGNEINGEVHVIRISRSGRRNLQSTPIGGIVTRHNPLSGLGGNVFTQVLESGAVEFTDEWRTFCECFDVNTEENNFYNPYVLGLKGNWRPKASYVHLTGRTQTFDNENSNIRVDGMFSSFSPFYKLQNGRWVIDRSDWTYTSSVVEFSPNGQALETIDALFRFSSSMYGFNQTMPTAVAANTRYRQLGFDGFEDYFINNCADNHSKFAGQLANGGLAASNNVSGVTTQESHTGRYSLRVMGGSSVQYGASLVNGCDEPDFVHDPCGINFICTSSILTVEPDLTIMTFTVSGGTGPYVFDYEINNSNVTIIIQGNQLLLHLPNDYQNILPLNIIVTIYDQTGCSKSFSLDQLLCENN
jgi:hypothetical protein